MILLYREHSFCPGTAEKTKFRLNRFLENINCEAVRVSEATKESLSQTETDSRQTGTLLVAVTSVIEITALTFF